MLYVDNNFIKYLEDGRMKRVNKFMAFVSAALFDGGKWYKSCLCMSKGFVGLEYKKYHWSSVAS